MKIQARKREKIHNTISSATSFRLSIPAPDGRNSPIEPGQAETFTAVAPLFSIVWSAASPPRITGAS